MGVGGLEGVGVGGGKEAWHWGTGNHTFEIPYCHVLFRLCVLGGKARHIGKTFIF